jgi:WD40 repeat protein
VQSGRFLFSGHEDSRLLVWDVTAPSPSTSPLRVLGRHTNRVTCVQVSPTGSSIASGSWDTDVLVSARALETSGRTRWLLVSACASVLSLHTSALFCWLVVLCLVHPACWVSLFCVVHIVAPASVPDFPLVWFAADSAPSLPPSPDFLQVWA